MDLHADRPSSCRSGKTLVSMARRRGVCVAFMPHRNRPSHRVCFHLSERMPFQQNFKNHSTPPPLFFHKTWDAVGVLNARRRSIDSAFHFFRDSSEQKKGVDPGTVRTWEGKGRSGYHTSPFFNVLCLNAWGQIMELMVYREKIMRFSEYGGWPLTPGEGWRRLLWEIDVLRHRVHVL